MPTHTRADVIGHAIQSVLDQTRPDFELLVVGDGCVAGTGEVVAAFGDPRIRFFDLPKAPHFGYANRNIALREARGALIGFAADDDLLFPDHLETLERGLAGGAALAYSQALWVSTDGVAAPLLTNLEMADELRFFVERGNTIPASCFLYRAEALPALDAWPENVPDAADLVLWRRIIGENPGRPLAYCRTPTVLHFSARWKRSRHSGMDSFAALLKIADGVDWWPDALRLDVPEGQTEQEVYAARMRHQPGWVTAIRLAAADVAARIAWDGVSAGHFAFATEVPDLHASLRAQEARAGALEVELAELQNSTSWRITAPLRAVSQRTRSFQGSARRALKLASWLGTGQFGRAVNAMLPYYRRYVPPRVKAMVPFRIRDAAFRASLPMPEDVEGIGGPHLLPGPEQLVDLAAAIRFPEIDEPEVSIIVPVFNQVVHTLVCLRSLADQECSHTIEVIVMDDCSSDRGPELLPTIPGIRYQRNPENLGFNRNTNRGADIARGRYLVFLNNDTKVLPGWLQALRETFDAHEKVGVVGSRLVYPDGRLQEAGGIVWEDGAVWNWGHLKHPNHPRYNFVRDVDYVSGASLMISRELFFKLGQFNAALENSYFEDTWLAFAAREAGYRVLYQPQSCLIHFEGATSGRDEGGGHKKYQAVNRPIFFDRWKHALRSHLPNGSNLEKASDRAPISHILVIDAVTPTPDRDSGSVDMFNLMKLLGGFGYRVHFVPAVGFANSGKYTRDLQAMGVECIYSPHYKSIRDFLTERGDMFSHVIIARAPVANAVFAIVEALAPSARKIFYTVDLHGLRQVRAAQLHKDDGEMTVAQETLRQELAFIERSDVAVVLSEYEAGFLREKGHDNIVVLPLIRDYSTRSDMPGYETRQGVVFIGGFQHQPNVDAVRWLVDELWPLVRTIVESRGLPRIKLRIVGSLMPGWINEYAGDDIEPVGYLESLEELFSRVRLSVAPLLYGAGLKGKVATSLSYGVPTIGTSTAFEGMPEDGLQDIRLCEDDPFAFARLVVDVYQDEERWRRVSSSGCDYVRRHFSMSTVAPQVRRILEYQAPGTMEVAPAVKPTIDRDTSVLPQRKNDPGMIDALQAYLDKTFDRIEGWSLPHLFQTISACRSVQRDLGLTGPVAEIGVYHGKVFIGLVLASEVKFGHHAIDVFDMQEFNLDGAGKGDLEAFVANLGRAGISQDGCKILRADSMTISPADIASIHRASGGFSIFSIDGCHMAGHTINDIRTAMELTDPRGIILVDDYHNADWPGVQEGVTKLYLYDNPRFVPLLYTCNKLFLCHVSHHGRYLANVRGTLEKHYPETRLKAVRRFGYDGLTATPDLSKRARLAH